MSSHMAEKPMLSTRAGGRMSPLMAGFGPAQQSRVPFRVPSRRQDQETSVSRRKRRPIVCAANRQNWKELLTSDDDRLTDDERFRGVPLSPPIPLKSAGFSAVSSFVPHCDPH